MRKKRKSMLCHAPCIHGMKKRALAYIIKSIWATPCKTHVTQRHVSVDPRTNRHTRRTFALPQISHWNGRQTDLASCTTFGSRPVNKNNQFRNQSHRLPRNARIKNNDIRSTAYIKTTERENRTYMREKNALRLVSN